MVDICVAVAHPTCADGLMRALASARLSIGDRSYTLVGPAWPAITSGLSA